MNKINFLKSIIVILTLVFSLNTSWGQDKTLVGKITTFDSIPLIGVNIEVKSTGEIVQTDSLGRFQVFCNPEDKIKIKADGFSTKKVKIKENIRLIFVNLKLKKGKNNFEQAGRHVNVGYGDVSSRDLLYSVSTANNKDIDFSNFNNVLDAIQGQFPGVTVTDGEIVVRGTKTLTGSQGNAALIVIDGIISSSTDLLNISVHDIKSIDVLKDGSASIYGSRGANGVVIITTKKGNE